ncbi:MAG: nuclear transport factor 2 family protein, partial [Magnetococcales bacterium]|nr:nuclear transport factor 2 family protein [Magnetococcales bacterium]
MSLFGQPSGGRHTRTPVAGQAGCVLLLSLTLTACAHNFVWNQAGASGEEYHKDMARCNAETTSATRGTAYGTQGQETPLAQDSAREEITHTLYERCMMAKGWVTKIQPTVQQQEAQNQEKTVDLPRQVATPGDARPKDVVAQGGPLTVDKPHTPPQESHAADAPDANRAHAEIEQIVQRWAAAWSARDVDLYLSFYSADSFVPETFPNRDLWQAHRKKTLRSARFIRVTLSNFHITTMDANRAQVVFTQDYQSNSYRDRI